MALIVEDGTGRPDAESYASIAALDAYAVKVGFNLTSYDTTAKEQALRRATRWIDTRYGASFLGTWSTTTQALEWPRAGVVYRGQAVAYNLIPAKLAEATIEAAFRELASPGSLQADSDGSRIKRDRVGDAETEFALSGDRARVDVPVVDGLLRGLLTGGASGYVGRAVRG